MDEHPSDYRVGYGKPPLHTRFRKGQSGNPLGARRHRRGETRLAALLEAALDGRTRGCRRRSATRREAIVTALVEKAAAGDLRAVKLLLDLIPRAGLEREIIDPEEVKSARERLIEALQRAAAEDQALKATRDESVCGD